MQMGLILRLDFQGRLSYQTFRNRKKQLCFHCRPLPLVGASPNTLVGCEKWKSRFSQRKLWLISDCCRFQLPYMFFERVFSVLHDSHTGWLRISQNCGVCFDDGLFVWEILKEVVDDFSVGAKKFFLCRWLNSIRQCDDWRDECFWK